MTQDHILRQFPPTRILLCELDPLRDAAMIFVTKLRRNNVDLEVHLMKDWPHGVCSFDLKMGGVDEAKIANKIVTHYFRKIFKALDKEYEKRKSSEVLKKNKI